ncbi:lipopolysaccharide-responsive and beige-like anchor protein isoform X2 [Dendropsophus ebraccatus]|uniref:lipopolysaccharide-responsive and beige-like anchor protein isoform X2 n=1 Tax=Dendropsophus ebraccatus TaxID=150705 RepID=UPI0038321245
MASHERQVQTTGDERRAEGPEPGAAKPLGPGVPIRGIRMKFAVLSGLLEVGEVTTRDLVETVYNLLVGGQFDLEMNFIIQEGESIICMMELLDKCDVTCQAEIWSMFTAILKKSIRNLLICTEVGLVELVLSRIDKVDSMIADLLVDMLGVLASYSITVRELKLFFSKLQGEKGHWPPHAVKLLSVLKHMPQKYGPDAFFNFPGKSAAAIALPPIAKWPYQNGFTFHTWLRMDPINNINVDKAKPYLYCFRTNKGLGYSAHFVGGCLIVTSIKSKGKGFQHCVKYDFKPQKWYMVSIVHIYNRWKNSELRCYVNGELASYGEITWLVNTSDTFDKCFLGSSETADANRVFCGQMASVYLFSEALNAAQIFAIYQLGPSYKGTFKFKAESDLFLAEHHKLLLYDGKLSASIAFTYNPRATDAQLCLESSPKDNASIFVHSPHALMLQDVKAVLTHSIQSAMHSIGGVQVLFPLFAQLDYKQYGSDHIDTSVCSTLLAFILELLKNSLAMQEQMLSSKGFLVIGYSLEKSSKSHVTLAVLELSLAFSKYLSTLQNGIPLLKQLCDHILLNPAIWIHTPAKVQLALYTYMSTDFISTVNIYNAVRRIGTVLLVMHTLKYYYWIVNPQDRSGIVAKGLDGPRPNHKEILALRAFLLIFIKQLVMKDYGVKEDELQAILNYLLTIHEDDNLMDVLQLLVALMSEHPNSMIPAFDQRNGLRVVYKLLASKSEGIRVQALKVLGYFLKHLSPKRKVEVMQGHGLFSLLAERLMLEAKPITITTYNVLFEILIEQISTQVIHKQHPDPDSSVKIQNPLILKVIATLLRNSLHSQEVMEVRRMFLSDMIKLFNNSRENRRSLLQCSVWQEWMLSLCYFSPQNTEEQKITEMVYAIFRILLYHAIKYEWGGWRVWVDTISITHSKVTYEMHKESMAQAFRDYEDHVGGEIGPGPSSPIRTVSGYSRQLEETPQTPALELTEIALNHKENTEHERTVQEEEGSKEGHSPNEDDREKKKSETTISDEISEGKNEVQVDAAENHQNDAEESPGPEPITSIFNESRDVEATPGLGAGGHESQDVEATPGLGAGGHESQDVEATPVPGAGGHESQDVEATPVPGAGGHESQDVEATPVPGAGGHESQDVEATPGLGAGGHESQDVEATPVPGAGGHESQDVEATSVPGAGGHESQDVEAMGSGESPSRAESQDLVEKEPNGDVTADAGQDVAGQTSISNDDEKMEVPEEQQTGCKSKEDATPAEGTEVEGATSDRPKSPAGVPEDAGVTDQAAASSSPVEIEGAASQNVAQDVAPTGLSNTNGAGEPNGSPSDVQHIERKIAKLDVSSIASDTENLELKASTSGQPDPSPRPVTEPVKLTDTHEGERGAPSDGPRRDSRSTMFRIPEFKWSMMHQRLLTDLLFSIETDIQMWRSHSTKTIMDFVNSSDNVIFVHNTIHLISQITDNMIMACGGILPLLSAATSATHELENIEPTQGLSIEASVTFLQRAISLVDVLIFASSLSFTDIEAEKNMSSGGVLRQCLRLVCAVAVRNCLECQQHLQLKSTGENMKNQKAIHGLVGTAKSTAKSPLDITAGILSPIRDVDRLLQDMDINRLRAVVFRDVEDSKQAQFLALAVVYFISVLMVSKYRDILEPQNERKQTQVSSPTRQLDNLSGDAGTSSSPDGAPAAEQASPNDSDSSTSAKRRDSGIGEETVLPPNSNLESDPARSDPVSSGPDAISEVLHTLSSEVKKSQESATDGASEQPATKNVNVKDILRSLVSSPAEESQIDPALIPPAFLGALGDPAAEHAVQFRSFDRSVVIAQKKSAAPAPSPLSSAPHAVSVVSSLEASQAAETDRDSSGSGSSNAKLPSVQAVDSVLEDSASHMSITERLEHALEKAAPLLREIFVDFAPFLSRTLLGSHGQELLIEGTSLVCMKSSSSVVELVMLLCSQEWQNSIQKNAGLAFIELVNEGRLLSQTMKDHLVRVANEAEFILSRQRAEEIHRHAEFESLCAQYSAEKREDEKMCDHLIRAAKYRDHVTATQLVQKIINILTDKHGAWGSSSVSRPREFWRLDYWEDDLRRRRRFVRNPLGSTHPEATLKAAIEHDPEENVIVKGKQSIKSQMTGGPISESDSLLEGDDDTLSSLEEKDLENVTGPVSLSTPAQLIAPSVVVRGTLSVTSFEVYFEVDEDDSNFKKIDPKIFSYTEGIHGKWLFTEIRSIFSRRYLLQNTALEIFMANRVAVMFNFPDQATVKKVVHCLPRVGIGTNFGLPQTRRISLASPRQIFKASNMTQRWQHREISNFEYLMFLNTIAGRTYNDLNQYPVFPWVITNYESEELDLTLPSNFRDLSKPVGALNPKRAAFFAERYESWEDDQVPKFHYGTHYSTASFVLSWLLRIEPFTTFFLNFQGGKFDHADRTFSSVSRAWRNSQRDTSDIKELIPEFYYLPEMFANVNDYNLGVMDDGTVVSDVELPPWAKTPEEFVRINRLALESEFVSCQLHQWIDLIFGYKQQGPEAVRALNVFYYLTYEGAVNLSSIADPVLREGVEAQIRSFGQTPSQLLIEPHPPRSSAMQVTPLMFTDQAQHDVIMVLKFPSNSPVTHVAANTQPGLASPAVITVTANRLFAVNKWHSLPAHQGAVQDQPYQLPVEIDPLIVAWNGILLINHLHANWNAMSCGYAGISSTPPRWLA